MVELTVCDICGKIVKDLRRHKSRRRCKVKGRRRTAIPPKYMPGTPEHRLRMDELGGR